MSIQPERWVLPALVGVAAVYSFGIMIRVALAGSWLALVGVPCTVIVYEVGSRLARIRGGVTWANRYEVFMAGGVVMVILPLLVQAVTR